MAFKTFDKGVAVWRIIDSEISEKMKFATYLVIAFIFMQASHFRFHVEAQTNGPEIVDAIIIDEVSEERGGCPSANARESVIQQIRADVSTKTTPHIGKNIHYYGIPPSPYDSGPFQSFDDYLETSGEIDKLTSILIRAGGLVDGYQVTYRLRNGSIYETPFRGNPRGGSARRINFGDDVFLTGIMGTYSPHLTSLGVINNRGQRYGPYGGGGGTPFQSTESILPGEPPGIVAVYGNSRGSGIGIYQLICPYCHPPEN